jgi:ABC-type dipeptide/oligopeptide/nickel transport system ATPase subunit
MSRKSIVASAANDAFALSTVSASRWRLEKSSVSSDPTEPARVPLFTSPWVLCSPRVAAVVCSENLLVIRAPSVAWAFSPKAWPSTIAVPNGWFAFTASLNGMRGTQLDKRAREVLEIVGLQDHANRNAGKFSRGMLQRVGLAQAMVNDPELLILDEPTSALDPLARVMVRELLIGARNAGKTIFLSSHLLSEVELICDRVAMLHRGKLARLGRTTDLLQAGERTEIIVRALAPSHFEGAAARDGVVSFSVPTHGQRAALEKVWNLGGEVVSVNPVRRSLEEIFLEVTAEPLSPLSKGVQ